MTGKQAGNRTTLPCQRDPERWFDPADRRHAFRGCLSCPRRGWCAGAALSSAASFGTWAGVWIDENLAEVAGLLGDIAAAAPPPYQLPPPQAQSQTPQISMVAAVAPLVEPDTVNRRVLAVITARSSGHCEAMTPHCRYTFDTVGSRIRGRSGWTAASASDAYAVCRPCKAAITRAEPVFAERLGYIVDRNYEPESTAFYWRHTRWVYLDGGSRISPLESSSKQAALSVQALNAALADPFELPDRRIDFVT